MSLYVLDTDALTLLRMGHAQVSSKFRQQPLGAVAITVLTVEEQLSGWYRRLRVAKGRPQLARAYARLADAVTGLATFQVLSFDEPAILRFESLTAMKLGVRKMDLRIAAVVLEHGGIVVSRNLRDFGRVPGLSIEDWSL